MTDSAQVQQRSVDEKVDLGQIVAFFGRHRRLILLVSGTTFAFGLVNALAQKPAWQGDCQIVLANPGSPGSKVAQLAAANPMLAGLAGLGGGGADNLETQVTILESPSVLLPVFEYVRRAKNQSGEDVGQLSYEGWVNSSLVIKLEKGTSVLNIRYRDSNKDLVIPVIQRISQTYQEYSGRDRRRELANAVTYLRGRIADLTPKADASMRKAQSFALAHGLGLQDGVASAASESAGASASPSPGSGSSGPVEAARLAAQNQVMDLRQQLANAQAAGSAVLFQAPQLTANADLYKQYQSLEAQLAEKRSRLRDNDDLIRSLQRQRSALITTLNRQTIGLLQGQLATAEANLQANSRPRDVVLQHRQLVRQALRDEQTLGQLENQLQLASLEQAKQSRPWDLISTPSAPTPVNPKRAITIGLGLLTGLVLGSGLALALDRWRGKLFSLDEFRAALPYPFLTELQLSDPDSQASLLRLLSQGPLKGSGSVGLIPVGVSESQSAAIARSLTAALQASHSAAEVVCSADLLLTRGCTTQVLLTSAGSSTRQQVTELLQQLQLQGGPVTGWLWLNTSGHA